MARGDTGLVSSADFAESSQRRMSWAAMLAVEHWVRRAGLSHPDVDEFLSHAWEWSSISSDTFDDWYRRFPRLQGLMRLPADVVADAVRAEVSADDLNSLVRLVDDIVYGNLFGGIQFVWFDQDLDGIAAILERYELGLPPPDMLPTSTRADAGGWGLAVDGKTWTAIRTLDWTAPRPGPVDGSSTGT